MWCSRRTGSSARSPRWRGSRGAAAVATKLVDLEDPAILYSAGDVLRRDGVCEQRGRFERDSGRYDAPGEVFSACAGAALYRRAARAGGRRLRRAAGDLSRGRRAGAAAAAGGLALPLGAARGRAPRRRRLERGAAARARRWVERNTLLLVARFFRLRWLPLVAYRQLAWAWHAARAGRLRAHLAGVADGAAAARRLRARARRLGGRGRGRHAAAADPRAPRGRSPVARTPSDDARARRRARTSAGGARRRAGGRRRARGRAGPSARRARRPSSRS